MSAIVPTLFGVEMSLQPPQTQAYTPVPPQVQYGKVRRSWFSYVLTTEVVATVIGLAIIPKNARISKSLICCNDGPGASVTFDVGLAAADGSGVLDADTTLEEESKTYDGLPAPAAQNDAGDFLGAFAPSDAAAVGAFADTVANHIGYYLRKQAILIATVRGATVDPDVTVTLQGYVDYVVD